MKAHEEQGKKLKWCENRVGQSESTTANYSIENFSYAPDPHSSEAASTKDDGLSGGILDNSRTSSPQEAAKYPEHQRASALS